MSFSATSCFRIYCLALNMINSIETGGNVEFPMNIHQKEQLHSMSSMMHSQNMPVSSGAEGEVVPNIS